MTTAFMSKGMLSSRAHPKGGSPDQQASANDKSPAQLDAERWAVVCHDSMQSLEARRDGAISSMLAMADDDMDGRPPSSPTLMGYALSSKGVSGSGNMRNAMRRAKLVDWQLDVCADPDPADVAAACGRRVLFARSFHAGVAFFDAFMCSHAAAYDHDSTRAQLQKYAAACIALGCKVEDVDYMTSAHLAELCMDTYTVEAIQGAEVEVAVELKFDLQAVTSAHYLDVYALMSGCGDNARVTEAAEAMLDSYLLHWELLGLPKVEACLLACGALYLARRLEMMEPFHHAEVARLSRHDEEHVAPIAAILARATVAAFSHDRLQAITRRYSGALWRSRLRTLSSML